MNDIQRLSIRHTGNTSWAVPNSDGGLVTYADHLAAVAAAEQRVKSDFAKYLRHMVDDDKFGAGVKAAREAVDNVPMPDVLPPTVWAAWVAGNQASLAAIDAVSEEGRNTG